MVAWQLSAADASAPGAPGAPPSAGPPAPRSDPAPSDPPADAVQPDPATEWALAARDGDPVAQAAFVRATQAEVWRFVAALIDPGAADDLTQETYLRAFRALPDFAGRSTARTWLLGIARRTCADHLRALTRRRRLFDRLVGVAATSGPVPDPAGGQGTADLLRRLPEQRRSAFVLTQMLGLSYAEAASVEGVPVGTIRSRVARARVDLVAAHAEAIAS